MTRRYCDKCGKELVLPVIFYEISQQKIDVTVYAAGFGSKVDLCQNCQEDLIAWIGTRLGKDERR